MRFIRRFFQRPSLVLFVCSIFLIVTLLVKGTLWRLWILNQELDRIQSEVLLTQEKSKRIDLALLRVQDPEYLERQARERLDMVNEDDLVFLFSAD